MPRRYCGSRSTKHSHVSINSNEARMGPHPKLQAVLCVAFALSTPINIPKTNEHAGIFRNAPAHLNTPLPNRLETTATHTYMIIYKFYMEFVGSTFAILCVRVLCICVRSYFVDDSSCNVLNFLHMPQYTKHTHTTYIYDVHMI